MTSIDDVMMVMLKDFYGEIHYYRDPSNCELETVFIGTISLIFLHIIRKVYNVHENH